jgi:predicted transcriptional regulator
MAIEQSLDKFQKMKRQRVAYVVSELVRRNGEADLKEFMGSIAMNYGIRKKTQEEYFEDLKYAGAIDIMEGSKIVLKWDIDKAKEWLKKQGVTL